MWDDDLSRHIEAKAAERRSTGTLRYCYHCGDVGSEHGLPFDLGYRQGEHRSGSRITRTGVCRRCAVTLAQCGSA